jgi:proline racemase
MAYGGNFYAIAPAASVGLRVAPENAGALIEAGLALMAAVPEPVHPEDPAIRGCRHVIWTDDERSAVAIHPGWVDRSPCGTGTSARMAALHARGELALGEPFVHRSIIGTEFTGRLVEQTDRGVIPEITGRAWITGMGQYLLDPEDPFPEGFRLG